MMLGQFSARRGNARALLSALGLGRRCGCSLHRSTVRALRSPCWRCAIADAAPSLAGRTERGTPGLELRALCLGLLHLRAEGHLVPSSSWRRQAGNAGWRAPRGPLQPGLQLQRQQEDPGRPSPLGLAASLLCCSRLIGPTAQGHLFSRLRVPWGSVHLSAGQVVPGCLENPCLCVPPFLMALMWLGKVDRAPPATPLGGGASRRDQPDQGHGGACRLLGCWARGGGVRQGGAGAQWTGGRSLYLQGLEWEAEVPGHGGRAWEAPAHSGGH